MDMVILDGPMEAHLRDIGKMTKYAVLAYINYKMVIHTKDNLLMTKCMVKVHINGLMGKFIKENTKIIKKTVMVNYIKQMVLNTMANGKMTLNTVKGSFMTIIKIKMVKKLFGILAFCKHKILSNKQFENIKINISI